MRSPQFSHHTNPASKNIAAVSGWFPRPEWLPRLPRAGALRASTTARTRSHTWGSMTPGTFTLRTHSCSQFAQVSTATRRRSLPAATSSSVVQAQSLIRSPVGGEPRDQWVVQQVADGGLMPDRVLASLVAMVDPCAWGLDGLGGQPIRDRLGRVASKKVVDDAAHDRTVLQVGFVEVDWMPPVQALADQTMTDGALAPW